MTNTPSLRDLPKASRGNPLELLENPRDCHARGRSLAENPRDCHARGRSLAMTGFRDTSILQAKSQYDKVLPF